MLIFNTTFHVADGLEDEFIGFLKAIYVPQALESNLLIQATLAKIDRQHEESGVSYALQFKTEDIDTLNKWVEQTGEKLSEKMGAKFGTKVGGFVTLLEEISLI